MMGGCRRRCTAAVLSFSAHARKWRLLFTEWSNDCSWLAAALASHEYIYMRWKEQVRAGLHAFAQQSLLGLHGFERRVVLLWAEASNRRSACCLRTGACSA